jgi:heme exporter protein A
VRQATRLTRLDKAAEPSAAPLIEARRLEKWYGPHPAVRGIDFSLPAGQFLTLFGPNGAGKTTLLKMLSGSLRPSRGEILFAGKPLNEEETDWRHRIGVLSHQSFLYSQLSAEENLRFFGRLYGLDHLEDRITGHLEEVGLITRRRDRVQAFSRGMQQRLALARTLLHEPELVLLDEPYTGLDPHAAQMLRTTLERLKDGHRTVLLITHNLTQGLELADRVVVQVAGRWVSDEPRARIDAGSFEQEYNLRVGGAL